MTRDIKESAKLPGHPHIARQDDTLHIEAMSLAALAREHGTPLFVYSKQWMLDALADYLTPRMLESPPDLIDINKGPCHEF